MSALGLQPGLKHRQTLRIEAGLTVPRVSPAFANFSEMPPVFATAFMVGFIESACIAALKPHLAHGQQTVGTHVDLSHIAATPVGMIVTAEVELIAVDGRKLRFKVLCRDDVEVICEGFHERHIVDAARFLERLERKAQAKPRQPGA